MKKKVFTSGSVSVRAKKKIGSKMNISRTFFLYFRLMKVVFITYKSLITSPGSVLDTSVSSVRRLDGFVLSFGVKRM